jgi:hypothetical protein
LSNFIFVKALQNNKAGVYILATFPPLEGGEKNRHFWKSGEENRPQREKNSIVKKKFEFYKQMFFSIFKKYIKESSF